MGECKLAVQAEERQDNMAAFGVKNTSHRGRMNAFGGLIIMLIEVNESKTRKITGHSTAEMTKRYAHFLVNDFADVLKITEGIVLKE